jgi:beta-N-acetylhexosaminidase
MTHRRTRALLARTRAVALLGVGALALAACAGTSSTARAGMANPGPVPAPVLAVVNHENDGTEVEQQNHPIWDRVHHMTLINRVRQLVVLPFSGTQVPTSMIDRYHPGGVIYFSGNLTSQPQTRALSAGIQRAAQGVAYPPLIMTDQEGHPVTRIPGTEQTPGGIEFHGNATRAHDTAVSTGTLMSSLGVNTNLAPVSDVNTAGPGGAIGDRSFGSTPGVVSRLVTAQICGYHSGGVATTAKHFPGLGSTYANTEVHTAVIHETVAKWRATDLPPFQAAVSNNVDMILVGHVAFPAMDASGRPASISRALNHDLIRSQLGYGGVVITDALNMGGITSWGTSAQIAVWAIQAGDDMLLMPPQPTVAIQAIWHAVLDGHIAEQRLNMSVFRVLKLKQTLGLLVPPKHLAQCGS